MSNIRFGMAGLGRLGYRHAENIAFKTPDVELAAVCSVVPQELERAALSFPAASRYADYAEMLKDKSLDAIFLCTPSGLHVAQIEAGLKAGFHVFSEKPLGVTVAECEHAEKVVASHPNQVFMLGFMRRYDESYAYAKRLIDEGRIGTPFMVRAYGLDPEALVAGAIKFAPTSGGIFLDMAVHDIDLANWYLGGTPESVWAIGGSYVHPEFGAIGDCDNACAMFQYKNGGMAFLYVGRTAPHGYHIETEIIGSKGTLQRQSCAAEEPGSGFQQRRCAAGMRRRFPGTLRDRLSERAARIRRLHPPGPPARRAGCGRNGSHPDCLCRNRVVPGREDR